MLMMRYRPSIVAPSGPYATCPVASLRIAIFCPPRSSVPMNFNGIGGTGGGGGGAGGAGPPPGAGRRGWGGGGGGAVWRGRAHGRGPLRLRRRWRRCLRLEPEQIAIGCSGLRPVGVERL